MAALENSEELGGLCFEHPEDGAIFRPKHSTVRQRNPKLRAVTVGLE